MRRKNGELIFSPSDLTRFNESLFASWMERFDLEQPGTFTKDSATDEILLFQDAGFEHERRFIEKLKADGRDVVEIDTKVPDHQKREATLQAIRDNREIICQAYLTLAPFAGFADFLVRSESERGMYEVWDAKLAKSPKPYFLLQLCCYAEMLEPILGRRPTHLAVVLGSNQIQRFRTDDYFFYYQRVKTAFLEQMQQFNPATEPPFPDPRCNHGAWTSRAEEILLESDHLFQVANITSTQIVKLNAVGITTVASLAESDRSNVPGITPTVFERLRNQARLQLASQGETTDSELDSSETSLEFEVIPYIAGNHQHGLTFLPPQSKLDVYFDIEGYPLVDGGLEYLFGAVTVENAEPQFHDWWAHNAAEEKRAFESFVDWVMDRFRRDPAMHIYHYAPYEVSALRRLMGRYATREDEVDHLLRAEVFVDLYQVVKNSVVVGGPDYSLKTIEKIYQNKARAGDVKTASGSVVAYAKWLASGESPDPKDSGQLNEIRDYNRIDCESTWQATEWLRSLQAQHGIPYISRRTLTGEETKALASNIPPEVLRRQELAQQLLARVSKASPVSLTENDFLNVILAQLLEFHRREMKPVFWAKFDRAKRTDEELMEDLACLGGLIKRPDKPIPIAQSLGFKYSFDATQDTKLTAGAKVYLTSHLNAMVEIYEMGEGELTLKVGTPTLEKKFDGEMPLLCSLIPNEQVRTKEIESAIELMVREWASGGFLPSAFRQILLRELPSIEGIERGTNLRLENETFVECCIRLAKGLQKSTLVIQGPPGTGKTYTAAAMIVALLREGKKVGITSNSHKAILNLVCAVVSASGNDFSSGGTLEGIVVPKEREHQVFENNTQLVALDDNSHAAEVYRKGLLAGTAWLFARAELTNKLDYLFVDEAGQVSLANLAGMAHSTKNIVLVGDQMQLGQPLQGSHPGESGLSLLDYYLRDQAVVPPTQGVFLAESRRMHPEICKFISNAFYEGRLDAWAGTSGRRLEVPAQHLRQHLVPAGIRFVDVPHIGNVQGSDEEVQAIVELTQQLLDCSLCDDTQQEKRPLTIDDILYVAPYNLQVRKLREALPAGARVGSVDKFQGQEAAVVIVSMCASAGEFGSRGLKFLLDTNRLNVAVSRAKVLTLVVGDGRIAESQANSVADMKLINLFCRLRNYSE
ncbi:MAG: TM0106 family RecB-like putative nuclease [Planctomycetaceae bacterium]|nr:TM0106 family RecB-like putative nuclease [Planctomycetaceae bacterium]